MLLGKTLVITGVSSGIGARTAALAIAQGADVIGIDMRDPPVAHGAFLKGDLSSPDGIAAVARQLPRRFDALLNVAGVSGTGGAAVTLAINFYGLRHFSETLAPHIREGGAVVNVASIAGYGWRANLDRAKRMVGVGGFPDILKVMADNEVPDEIGYPLSKELLLLWTQVAAHQPLFRERGIRVNAVSPGPVETPILKQFRDVLGDEKVDSDIVRTGRAATASDIAPVILFAASDAARWINGANLAADGGLEASINADVLGFK
jgi:NAD(P)-dependent dehydrogenase (short-subunit alcohol dehydrogenase family)